MPLAEEAITAPALTASQAGSGNGPGTAGAVCLSAYPPTEFFGRAVATAFA